MGRKLSLAKLSYKQHTIVYSSQQGKKETEAPAKPKG